MSNRSIYSIPNPCHEDWNKMTPNEKGRYCGICNKTVIDFSKMSKIEIQDYFRNIANGSKICGSFNSKQLNPKSKRISIQTWSIDLYQNASDKLKNPLFRKCALFLIGIVLILTGCKSNTRTTGVIPLLKQEIDTTMVGDIAIEHPDSLKRRSRIIKFESYDSINRKSSNIDQPQPD
jgi:hypothetical protein